MKHKPTKRENKPIERILKAWNPILQKAEKDWKEWYSNEAVPAINKIFSKEDDQK